MTKKTHYIPAMHFHWLTPFYDDLVEKTLPDAKLKNDLIRQAAISPGETVLDVGCGTGILAMRVKRAHPDVNMAGLDIDEQILDIARRKAGEAGLEISFHQGTASCLPYPDRSFDRVLSSFVFHHLNSGDKQRAAAEAFRVLRPGGELHVLDFGKPHSIYGLLVSYLLRWTEELMDNVKDVLPVVFRSAGFVDVQERSRVTTLLGSVSLYQARRPG